MVWAFIICCAAAISTGVSADVVDAYFRADVPFPQFSCFWSDSSLEEVELYGGLRDLSDVKSSLGGSLHVYLVNTLGKPVKIEDVLLDGISLKRAIAYSDQRKFKRVAKAASIYFSDLSEAERNRLVAAGEPVWYKVEPEQAGPGESMQVIVRLRRVPRDGKSVVTLKYAGGQTDEVPVVVKDGLPQLAGISFSRSLDTAYLYARYSRGKFPSKVLLDGRDITGLSVIGKDPALDLSPVVCKLKRPLKRGSVHCFQITYDDGSKATAAIRAYSDEMTYAIWGARLGKETDMDTGRTFIKEIAEHNINVQMEIIGSDAVRAFMHTDEGKQMLKSLGIHRIVSEPDKWGDPWIYYLADEPDTADFKVQGVPPHAKVGCLGQGLLDRAAELRRVDPDTPSMLNVNMTFKPDNWYTYGQVPDIFAADPYYQTRLCQVYWDMPGRLPVYTKCTFVYAVASICNSACQPNPLHIILNSSRRVDKERAFRFGTPEEKRIELYYALAAGAKAFSYWWYTPLKGGAGSDGCGSEAPGASELWREIGLLGAEARTAGPVITRSCPADLKVTGPKKLWVRSLASGLDTLVVLCVNDDYANDRVGTVIKPIENANVKVSLPAWLEAKSVFELDFNGIHDVDWSAAGSNIEMKLGTVNVTRMVIVTANPLLRDELQKLYGTKFAANVRSITPTKK